MNFPERQTARAHLKKIKNRLKDACWDLIGFFQPPPAVAVRPQTLLFLCQGNICRSPFAERIARRLAGEDGRSFLSAGMEVSAANPPPPAAIEAARLCGIDLADHRSQSLTEQMMKVSDAVFVMEVGQRMRLKRQYPSAAGKIHLLPLFDHGDGASVGGYEKYNVRDPFGQPVDDFLHCYRRISRCIEAVLKVGSQPVGESDGPDGRQGAT